jgi:hypothetical protein
MKTKTDTREHNYYCFIQHQHHHKKWSKHHDMQLKSELIFLRCKVVCTIFRFARATKIKNKTPIHSEI